MTTDAPARRTWRDAAVTRVLGSAFGWFSGALAITLLFQAVSALADLGGYCARGGPFEIAVECTDAIVAFTPGSIVGGLVAVFIGSMLAQGFGVSMLAFAWPALFVSLAVTFFRTFAQFGDLSGLLIGVMFVVMGLAPLVLMLRAAPQRLLLGRVDAQGRPFWEAPPRAPTCCRCGAHRNQARTTRARAIGCSPSVPPSCPLLPPWPSASCGSGRSPRLSSPARRAARAAPPARSASHRS